MSSTLPRVGIIGAGGIGKTHLRAWAANGVTPTAITDAKPEILAEAIAAHGGQAYETGFDLIASGTVDVVSICTPPAFHAGLAIAALEAGVAVLCEKPLATTVDDAERVAAVAGETGVLIAMGFCHRFQPHIEKLKAMIDEGQLGTVRGFRNRFAGHLKNAEGIWFSNPRISGGGALIDTSVHSVDLFRYLFGDPDRVEALTSTVATDLGPALEVEDTGVIVLRTAAGVIGVIEASWKTPSGEWTVSVFGTGGSATVNYADNTLRYCPAGGAWGGVEVEDGDRFVREITSFIDCWRGDQAAPRATVHDGVAATRILANAYASAGSA